MQQKKKPVLQSKTKKRNSTGTKRKTKKNRKKIYIPLNSILIFCAAVLFFCTILIVVSPFSSSKSKVNTPGQNQKIENIKKGQNISKEKKSEVQKNQSAKINKNQKETQKKALPQVKTEKPKEKKKTPTNLSKENKTENVPIIESTKKMQEEAKTSNDIPNFPMAQNNATLTFIFDDAGHNIKQLQAFLALPFPITVAVLPCLSHSSQAAELVRKSGNEVILHQPMQSINLSVNPGEGAITPEMDEETIKSTVLKNIFELWPISGMNNHEGSLITSDAEKMAVIMSICSQQEIYFLDSRTNSESKVRYVSQMLGYPYYERNIFLDNTKNRNDILLQIKKGVEFSNKTGNAIMIGHIWSAEILPSILKELFPILSKKGYSFTTVSNSGALKR